jgi:glycosyltransferase
MGGMSTKNYVNNLKAQKKQVLCWEINGETPPFYMVPLKLIRKVKQFLLAAVFRVIKRY